MNHKSDGLNYLTIIDLTTAVHCLCFFAQHPGYQNIGGFLVEIWVAIFGKAHQLTV